MERMTVSERQEAVQIILAESNLVDTGAGASPQEQVSNWLTQVELNARVLHRLYKRACSEPLTPAQEKQVADYEAWFRAAFARLGLGLYLNGDPRGNPVGVLTPKTGRCNTMGGAEAGWRL